MVGEGETRGGDIYIRGRDGGGGRDSGWGGIYIIRLILSDLRQRSPHHKAIVLQFKKKLNLQKKKELCPNSKGEQK